MDSHDTPVALALVAAMLLIAPLAAAQDEGGAAIGASAESLDDLLSDDAVEAEEVGELRANVEVTRVGGPEVRPAAALVGAVDVALADLADCLDAESFAVGDQFTFGLAFQRQDGSTPEPHPLRVRGHVRDAPDGFDTCVWDHVATVDWDALLDVDDTAIINVSVAVTAPLQFQAAASYDVSGALNYFRTRAPAIHGASERLSECWEPFAIVDPVAYRVQLSAEVLPGELVSLSPVVIDREGLGGEVVDPRFDDNFEACVHRQLEAGDWSQIDGAGTFSISYFIRIE